MTDSEKHVGCVIVVRLDEKVEAVVQDVGEVRGCIVDVKKAIGELKDSMAELRLDVVKSMAARPTWAVTIVLTILSSLSLSLSVYVITVALRKGNL